MGPLNTAWRVLIQAVSNFISERLRVYVDDKWARTKVRVY